jgi:hypothetical protein
VTAATQHASIRAHARSRLPWRAAVLATLAVAAAAAVALAALPSAALWSRLTPADCAEYCEAHTRCGPLAERAAVQQPANAWSNLAYLCVGALAWRRRPDATRALFAASCAVLGVGSFLFHASVTREMQWLDMVGTYAVLIAVLARASSRAFHLADAPVALAALGAAVLVAIFKWRIDAWIALPLLLAACALPIAAWVRAGRISTRRALVPLGLFAAAFALRQLDVAHVACAPQSLLQGHALWHLLTAASLGSAFFAFDEDGHA